MPGTGLVLDGSHWAETPDDAALDITGDIDIRAAIAPTDWTPASAQNVLGKWAANNQSYGLDVLSTSQIHMAWDDNGTGPSIADQSGPTSFTDGTLHAIRAVLQINTGGGARTTTFYTKATTAATALADCADDTGWTTLSTITGNVATSIFSGNAPLRVGTLDGDTGFFIGTVYAVVVKNGVNGTTVADPDFYSNDLPFTDAAGRSWTYEPPGITVGLATETDSALAVSAFTEPLPQNLARATGTYELGCGTYVIHLTERGGGNLIAKIPVTSLAWSRVVDDVSSASFTIPVGDQKLMDLCWVVFNNLDVDCFSHEISIYRNSDLVWVGPIVGMVFNENSVQLDCRDLFVWFDKRWLPKTRSVVGDFANLFRIFASDALDQESSPNITIVPFATNEVQFRQVRKQDYINAGTFLRELGRDGVDFTMVGRELLEGDLDGLAGLRGIDLFLPQRGITTGTLERRGMSMATQLALTGQPPGGSQSTISDVVGGKDEKYGLIQVQQAESFITLHAFLHHAAKSRLEMIKIPPRYFTATCAPTAPFRINDLIAGLLVPVELELGCLTIREQMRLHQVQGSVSVDDTGAVTEKIELTLIPKGQPGLGLGFDLGFNDA